MTISAQFFSTRESWLQARGFVIGGSDVSALAGLNSYKTELELYLEKTGQIEPVDISNEPHIRRGQYFEKPIAQFAADQNGWELIPLQDWPTALGVSASGKTISSNKAIFTNSECEGLGTTPDFLCRDDQGLFALEIKSHRFSKWKELGEQPSMSAELQLQAQLLCMGLSRGAIVCWIEGGSDVPLVFYRERHEASQDRLKSLVAAFWKRVADGDAPSVSDGSDLSLLHHNQPPIEGAFIDLASDCEATELVQAFALNDTMAKEMKKAADKAKAQLVEKMGNATSAAFADGSRLKRTLIKGKPAQVVERKATADTWRTTFSAPKI